MRTAVRVIKYLFFILFLLSLIYIGKLLIFNSPMDMLKESFKALLEEAIRKNTEEQNRIETISRLLNESRSLKNVEQLEIFKQNLRKAVNEAYEQETEDKYRIVAMEKEFNQKMVELYPNLQIVKQASNTDPSSRKLLEAAKRILSTFKAFIDLRKRAFVEGAQETEENMNEILKSQQDLHDEL